MKNNTKGLRREMTKLLDKSDSWIVIREDSDGVHLHTPQEADLALLVMLFKGDPELFEIVTSIVMGVTPEEFDASLN